MSMVVVKALRIGSDYIPPVYPSWLALKVGTAAGVAFSGYNLWYDKFSSEVIAFTFVIELCCLMFWGIITSHQSAALVALDNGLGKNSSLAKCFEATYFMHCSRNLEGLYGLFNLYMQTGFRKFNKRDFVQLTCALILVGYSNFFAIKTYAMAINESEGKM